MPFLHAFTPAARAACMAVFDSNCPQFMHPAERVEFERWLEDPAGTYLVMEHEREIVGCGGFVVEPEDHRLTLTWGLVHSEHHGRGLGGLLLLERLVQGIETGDATHSGLGTAPSTEAFFARVGFERCDYTPDGWAPGMDRVDMRLDRTPESAARLRRRLEELRARLDESLRS